MSEGKVRWTLGVLLALQAVGAIGGAVFVVPSQSVSGLKAEIFADYTIPALALGVVVGGGALVALALLVRRSGLAWLGATGAGVAVMIFEVVEVTATKETIFTDPGLVPLWQQPLWFAIGAAIVLLALAGHERRAATLAA